MEICSATAPHESYSERWNGCHVRRQGFRRCNNVPNKLPQLKIAINYFHFPFKMPIFQLSSLFSPPFGFLKVVLAYLAILVRNLLKLKASGMSKKPFKH